MSQPSDSVVWTRDGLWRGLWYPLGLLIVLALPSRIWLGQPFWSLQANTLPSILLMGVAYAGAVLVVTLASSPGRSRIFVALLTVPAFFAAAYSFRFLRQDLPFSRGVIGISLIITLLAVLFGESVRGRGRPVAVGLAGFVALICLLIGPSVSPTARVDSPKTQEGAPAERIREVFLRTAYHPVRARYYGGLVMATDVLGGGAIERVGDDYVAATGKGAFYRLRWLEDADSVSSEKLAIPSPLNFAAFGANNLNLGWFRVMGLAHRARGDGWELFAAHHYWRSEEQCSVFRVSSLTLGPHLEVIESPESTWQTVFETRPCLSFLDRTRGGGPLESGGRLVWLAEDTLLLTVGDHEFDGWNRPVMAAQDDSFSYGKTILLDLAGGQTEYFTTGHRNPQGLSLDQDGLLWLTEHGPEGGDELNLLVRGHNYGWPYETHGTEYGHYKWPPSEEPHGPADFDGPVFSWVPAIGVSDLIRVQSDEFPRWRGDLLVAGMRAGSLFRLKLLEERVVHSEPIEIGCRIRDIIEGPGGRIWLWSDEGVLVSLSIARDQDRGEEVFAQCAECHKTTNYPGPYLPGIVDSPIARRRDFEYSTALRSLDGRWTETRLDEFLRSPSEFAPGTSMIFPGIQDAEDRRAVIAYLRELPRY